MPRSRFTNNVVSTVMPISHFYLGDDETDYLGKCFTGEVESVRLTFEDQYDRTRDLQCEIAEDVDFLPNEGVVLFEHPRVHKLYIQQGSKKTWLL